MKEVRYVNSYRYNDEIYCFKTCNQSRHRISIVDTYHQTYVNDIEKLEIIKRKKNDSHAA